MAGLSYNIVNFCRLCKRRYVSKKGDPKMYYCVDCQKRIAISKRAEEKSDAREEAKRVEKTKAKEEKKKAEIAKVKEEKKKVKEVKKAVKKKTTKKKVKKTTKTKKKK